METMEEKSITKFDKVTSWLGEWFPDYVVIVRLDDGFIARHSSREWAVGAMRVFSKRMESEEEQCQT